MGPKCEEAADKCLSNPCQNVATCVNLVTSYQCHCEYPYVGTHCETDTDACVPNPCLHAGTCFYDENNRLNVKGYRCSCAPGFIGKCLHYRWMNDTSDNVFFFFFLTL